MKHFSEDCIRFLHEDLDKPAIFTYIGAMATEMGLVDYPEHVVDGLWDHELAMETDYGAGIAFPFCVNDWVKKSALFIIRLRHPIAWSEVVQKKVETLVVCLVKESDHNKVALFASIQKELDAVVLRKELGSIESKEQLVEWVHVHLLHPVMPPHVGV
ncbi:MAG: PTS sugar transporter subunit IIA [Erysipelotrichaceae bacterium]